MKEISGTKVAIVTAPAEYGGGCCFGGVELAVLVVVSEDPAVVVVVVVVAVPEPEADDAPPAGISPSGPSKRSANSLRLMSSPISPIRSSPIPKSPKASS